MILRDYQKEIMEKLYAAWESGCRSVMCQMPTGTGKTVVLSQIVQDKLKSDEWGGVVKVLVVAHRQEILEQIRKTLAKYGLGDALDDGCIVVESVQKLSRMVKGGGSTAQLLSTNEGASPALVIIDEAHHCTAKTYRRLWEMFPKAKFLGMTATPSRMMQEGFTDLFDRLICSYPIAKFIYERWLANYEFISIRTDSETRQMISGLKKRAVDGDYQTKEMEEVLGTRASIEQLYRSYKEYADGKKGIIYAINREHAQKIAAYYIEAMAEGVVEGDSTGELLSTLASVVTEDEDSTGELLSTLASVVTEDEDSTGELLSTVASVGTEDEGSTGKLLSTGGKEGTVAVVDSTTPRRERERINREYREGKIRILVNCEIYGEGYDVKDVEFIQMARPTLSLNKYLQQVGRGLRPNKDGRKTVILDNVGMYYRFGLPHEDRDWERMFRFGQLNNEREISRRLSNQKIREMKQGGRLTTDIDSGHNLEMVCIANDYEIQQELDLGYSETEVFEKDGKYGIRRGSTLLLMPEHDKIGRFVGGYAMVDDEFFVDEYGMKYSVASAECKQRIYDGGFTQNVDGAVFDIIYGNQYNELPADIIMLGGFIPLVRIGELYYLRGSDRSIAFRKEDLWMKGNGFQRRNALNPGENIYMNRLTGTQTFLFVGYYSDGAKKVRDYKDGKYYIVEQGGAPVWDGAPAMPLDTEEYRSIVRGAHREERLIRDSISRKNGSWYINDY